MGVMSGWRGPEHATCSARSSGFRLADKRPREGEPLPSTGRGTESRVCLVVVFLTLCPSSGPDPSSWNQGALSLGTPEEKGHFPRGKGVSS